MKQSLRNKLAIPTHFMPTFAGCSMACATVLTILRHAYGGAAERFYLFIRGDIAVLWPLSNRYAPSPAEQVPTSCNTKTLYAFDRSRL